MNSRCTSQQPGGAGSSEPSDGIITVIGGCSVAESMGPRDFFPLISNGSIFFSRDNFSYISKDIMEKSRKNKKVEEIKVKVPKEVGLNMVLITLQLMSLTSKCNFMTQQIASHGPYHLREKRKHDQDPK